MANFCLGRLPKTGNEKAPYLRAVLKRAGIEIRQPVLETNWRKAIKTWPMLANDDIGDCVIAGMLHYEQAVSANANTEVVPDEPCAIADYTLVGQATSGKGYDPATGANDNGLIIDQAVQYWIDKGIAIYQNGHFNQLAGQARIDPSDIVLLKNAIDDFCGVLCGVNLPTSAQDELTQGKPWESTTDEPGTWGGHCIYIIDFDQNWLYCVTWGQIQLISWAWFNKYCDEVVVVLSRDWINSKTKESPLHMTLAALDQEISELDGTLGNQANG